MDKENKPPAYTINATAAGVVVTSPYNQDFVQLARSIGGVWDKSAKTWTFKHKHLGLVRKMCEQCFGDEERPREKKEVAEAVKGISEVLGVAAPGMVRVARGLAMTIGFGVNGFRGLSDVRSLMGRPPQRRGEGIKTVHEHIILGGNDLAYDRGLDLER